MGRFYSLSSLLNFSAAWRVVCSSTCAYTFAVNPGDSWPSVAAISRMPTPAWSCRLALVWRRACSPYFGIPLDRGPCAKLSPRCLWHMAAVLVRPDEPMVKPAIFVEHALESQAFLPLSEQIHRLGRKCYLSGPRCGLGFTLDHVTVDFDDVAPHTQAGAVEIDVLPP